MAATVLAVILIALAAHTWPIRELVRAEVVARATELAGAPVSIRRVGYNLAALWVEADDVAIRPSDPQATHGVARRVIVDLSWKGLLAGRIDPERIVMSDLDVTLRFGNRSATADLRGLQVRMSDDADGRLAGQLRLEGPGSIVVGSAAAPVTRLEAAIALDGRALSVDGLSVAGAGIDLRAAGRVEDVTGGAPHASLRGTWRGTVPELCASWVSQASCDPIRSGALQGPLTVDGPLTAPLVRLENFSGLLFVGAGAPIALHGDATVSRRALEIARVGIVALGGTASGSGVVAFGGTSQPTDATLTWRGIDVRRLLDAAKIAWPLAATFDGRVALDGDLSKPIATGMNAVASATLLPSRSGGRTAAGRISAALKGGRWSVQMAAGRIGATSIEGVASSRLDADAKAWAAAPLAGSVQVQTSDLHDLIGALRTAGFTRASTAAVSEWQARGALRLDLGGTLRRPVAAGRVEATAARPRDESPIASSALIRYDSTGLHVQSLRATRGSDRLEGFLTFNLGTRGIDGEFTATLTDLGALETAFDQRTPTVRGAATVNGRMSGTTARPAMHAAVRGANVELTVPSLGERGDPTTLALGAIDVELRAEDRIELSVDVPGRGIAAAAVLERRPEARFEALMTLHDIDLAALMRSDGSSGSVSGRVDGSVSLRGRAARLADIDADVQVNHLDAVVHGLRVGLEAPARVRVESLRLTEARVDATVGDLAARITRTDAREPVHVRVEGRVPFQALRLPEALTVVIDALVDDRGAEIRSGSARMGLASVETTARVPWAFLQPWLAGLRHERVEPAESPAIVTLEVRAFPVALIAAWLPGATAPDVGGVFDVVLDADARFPTIDALRVDGRVEHARLEHAGLHLAQEGTATIAVRGRSASLTDWRWSAPGADLTMRADATLDAAAPRVDGAIVGEFDLARFVTLAEHRAAGVARVDMSLTGGAGPFSWNGRVDVRDATWVARRHGIAVTDVTAALACTPGRCGVEHFAGRLNGGTLTLAGDLPLAGAVSARRLEATVREASFEFPRGTRHDIDADLGVDGTGPRRLTGTVTVWPTTMTGGSITALSDIVESVRGVSSVETRRGWMSAVATTTSLDVHIVSGEDLTFDSTHLQLAVSADLRVRGTLAEPRLQGEAAARGPGRVFLASRMWELEDAALIVTDSPRATDARVAATARTQISRYAVRMSVSGPASRPAFSLSSDPPLQQGELTALVMTGTTGGDLARGGSQPVATLVSTELLTSIGRTVGVDAIRIDQTQSDLSSAELEPVSRLTVSKRITDRVEIVYSQGLRESDDLAWILVLRPGWYALDLRATIRTNGAEAYEVRQEREFGTSRPRASQPRSRRPEAPIVSRVEVAGLRPEESAAVRDHLSMRPGVSFSTSEWQRDRQTVTRYFHERDRLHVRVRASHVVEHDGTYLLNYEIKPGPITRLDVSGYRLGPDTLAALRAAWTNAVIEDLLVDEWSELVRVELAARGHLMAEVATTFSPLQDGGRLGRIQIVPGVRSARRAIKYAGNETVSAAELDELVKEKRLQPRCWLDPSLLEAPVAALYRTRGHLAVRVSAARVVAAGRATLTVRIAEGRPFQVGAVTFTGTAALGERNARAAFGLNADAPFSMAALSGAAARLRTAYLRSGYRDVDVEPGTAVRSEHGIVDVTVTVTEGQRSVLRALSIEGRDETSATLMARVLDLPTGAALDTVALEAAQRRLYDTGIFRAVDVDVQPAPGADDADQPVHAVVKVEERAQYRVRYGVQFGPTTIENITTSDNSAAPGATFDFQRRNLYGQGITAGGGGVWSADQHRVRGTVSAATLRGRFVSTTFTIEHANQDRTSDEGLQVVDRSFRTIVEQRWRFGRDRRVEVAYGLDVDHRRLELRATADWLPLRARLAGLNTTFTYDSRDDRLNPRGGMFHTSRVEWGAGWWLSEIAYARYQVQQFTYRPIGPVTLASGVRFGTLDVDNESDPASMLLYFKTGGGASVRGYDDDALTPAYALGAPVGGKVLLVLNEEVRARLTKRFGVVAFVDAGNTFEGLNTFDLGGLRVGVGGGVRVDTRVAVLRLDVGIPLQRPAGSPRARWYASIGQAF